MQYHEVVILLHRSFLSLAGNDATSLAGQSTAPSALQACTESATEVCRLIRVFRLQFGIARLQVYSIHVLLIAGLIHAYNSCHLDGSKAREAREMAGVCIDALGELAVTFNSSKRALEILVCIRRDWYNELAPNRKRKRSLE
jgi:hypothetical protein